MIHYFFSASMKKGRLISLFSDIQRSGDQNNKITITAEIIEDIFNMYPAVKRAYMVISNNSVYICKGHMKYFFICFFSPFFFYY